MARFKFKKQINIGRVVSKIAVATLVIYVGGLIMSYIGQVMNETEGSFNGGFKLIGYTVGSYPACATASQWSQTCDKTALSCSAGHNLSSATGSSCITSVNGNGGLLTVVGVIAFASIVLEFVEIKLH